MKQVSYLTKTLQVIPELKKKNAHRQFLYADSIVHCRWEYCYCLARRVSLIELTETGRFTLAGIMAINE